MDNYLKKIIFFSLLLLPARAVAQEQNVAAGAPAATPAAVAPDYTSPEGFWYEPPTKRDFGSVFHIYKVGDQLQGQIAILLPRLGHPDDDLGTRCSGCEGALKDHPTIGLPFIYGFKPSKSVTGRWDEGHVIDPRSGHVYSARMETVDGGRRLKVRGYLGTPMLGGTVYWQRVISTTNFTCPLPPLAPEGK